MSDSAAVPKEPADRPAGQHAPQASIAGLTLLAMGVVFGDIGTSPLYALRETFAGAHPLPINQIQVFGVISLIFWSMMLVVSIKYITILTRADNKGEGGSLALLALISRKADVRWSGGIVLLGVFACALFYGDSMITPAISVLSAVEGLTVVEDSLQPLVVPIAIAILIGLFLLQRTGTARVGALFGPIVVTYFLTLAILGSASILRHPEILWALNPWYALNFFLIDKWLGFLALGSVVLAVTGTEALYADMGHFGRKPIRNAWVMFVMPALMLNYMGQGALLIADPSAVSSPFFMLAPEWFRLPLVFIATLATIVASQAVISGAFSVTQQAVQLGFVPRMRITHTSARAAGQIYIPAINNALMVLVILLVLFFQNSSNLAAAYGVAVTGAMLIDTCLLAVVLFSLWKWPRWASLPLLAIFFIVDITYFAANLTKVPNGGWFPLLIGLIGFTLLTTWARGRKLMIERMDEAAIPLPIFVKSAASSATRVPGTAVFMTTSAEGVPHSLLHNLKHNKVIHERVILLTVRIEDVPFVDQEKSFELKELGSGFFRLIVRYGFMQETNVPAALARVDECGPQFKMMDTSFFLARQTLITSATPGMAVWREKLFAWMLRNAESAMEFFKLPPNRVVELGAQVEI
ncbi:potassium transporter Kup [Sphingosinicella sp. CPCC 101087]|uniref:potassium transporter Kup n=1 Tax=Sphingosinicella sp. CPCC 101087 TaxID=2497754 RepID=UPI00101C5FD8|nr:potassium transporter Kup [Sphingosinicella sp. CPCC 101087]